MFSKHFYSSLCQQIDPLIVWFDGGKQLGTFWYQRYHKECFNSQLTILRGEREVKKLMVFLMIGGLDINAAPEVFTSQTFKSKVVHLSTELVHDQKPVLLISIITKCISFFFILSNHAQNYSDYQFSYSNRKVFSSKLHLFT